MAKDWRTCRTCGKPAACIGSYETYTNPEPSCDECCGHGNEDGWCVSLEFDDLSELVDRLMSAQAEACAQLVEEIAERTQPFQTIHDPVLHAVLVGVAEQIRAQGRRK